MRDRKVERMGERKAPLIAPSSVSSSASSSLSTLVLPKALKFSKSKGTVGRHVRSFMPCQMDTVADR